MFLVCGLENRFTASWLKASFTLLHSQLLPGCLGRTQGQETGRRNEGKNIKKQSLTLNWRWQDQTAFLCPLSKLSYHGHWLSAFAFQTSLKFDLCSCKTSLFKQIYGILQLFWSVYCLFAFLIVVHIGLSPRDSSQLYLFRHQFCQSRLIS